MHSSDKQVRIDMHVGDALEDAFDAIWSDIVAGRYTAEEAHGALHRGWGDVVANLWDEWYAEEEG